ncbi:MAG TPA: alpha/beta hydrolase [Polyangia bacterium]|nr:alpha/beta hydrolase [Polyangia bacterium]
MSQSLNVEGIGNVKITFTERGEGRPVLLLHGGAGPLSVVPWAEAFARTRPARVITPTHPGFMGTPRPEALADVGGLARVYEALVRQLAPTGATVIGNSIGGWIAAELALRAPNLVDKLVLVDAVGIELPGHPVADPFALSLEALMNLSYHDPVRFRIDPSKLTPQQQAAFGANRAALETYAGGPMDAGLRARLAALTRPTLVVWGEADRVADVDYGRAFAAAIPGARFQLLAGTGHVPQIETPELLAETIWPFISG